LDDDIHLHSFLILFKNLKPIIIWRAIKIGWWQVNLQYLLTLSIFQSSNRILPDQITILYLIWSEIWGLFNVKLSFRLFDFYHKEEKNFRLLLGTGQFDLSIDLNFRRLGKRRFDLSMEGEGPSSGRSRSSPAKVHPGAVQKCLLWRHHEYRSVKFFNVNLIEYMKY
jgi:hypothetical protein